MTQPPWAGATTGGPASSPPATGAAAAPGSTPTPAGAPAAPAAATTTPTAPSTGHAVAAPSLPHPSSARRRLTPRRTRDGIRRIGAIGLLAGTLTGVTGFAAADASYDSAQQASAATTAARHLSTAKVALSAAAADADAALIDSQTPTTSSTTYTHLTKNIAVANASLVNASAWRADLAPTTAQLTTTVQTYATQLTTTLTRRDATASATPAATLATLDSRLDTEISSQTDDARTAGTRATLWTVIATATAVLSLLTLGYSCVWLARTTHRVVNVPLTVGTALVAVVPVVLIASSGAVTRAVADAGDARQGSLATKLSGIVADRKAVTAALRPGSTDTVDDAFWQHHSAEIGRVVDSFAPDVTSAWKAYATSRDTTASTVGTDRANAAREVARNGQTTFAALEDALVARTAAAPAGTDTAGPATTPLAPWLLLLAGVFGGIGALVGAAARLREYR